MVLNICFWSLNKLTIRVWSFGSHDALIRKIKTNSMIKSTSSYTHVVTKTGDCISRCRTLMIQKSQMKISNERREQPKGTVEGECVYGLKRNNKKDNEWMVKR